MNSIDQFIENASTEELRKAFMSINEKLDERRYEKNNPLYEEVTEFFSQGDCFLCKNNSGSSCSYLFIKDVRVNKTPYAVVVSYEEGYSLSWSDTHRKNVMLSKAKHEVVYDIDDRLFDKSKWKNIDADLFAGSKDFLEDISKKVKKWMDNQIF